MIDWTINDGVAISNTGSSELTVVHAAPTVMWLAGAVTFTGGGSAVALDSGIVVTDPDSGGDLTGATITIGSGFAAGDILNFGSQNGITGVYDIGTLTLSGRHGDHRELRVGSATSITYGFQPGDGDPTAARGEDTSRIIDWVVNDGVAVSNTGSSEVDTTHAAPTVTALGTVTFTGGGSAVALDSGIVVTDPDSGGALTGATISDR